MSEERTDDRIGVATIALRVAAWSAGVATGFALGRLTGPTPDVHLLLLLLGLLLFAALWVRGIRERRKGEASVDERKWGRLDYAFIWFAGSPLGINLARGVSLESLANSLAIMALIALLILPLIWRAKWKASKLGEGR